MRSRTYQRRDKDRLESKNTSEDKRNSLEELFIQQEEMELEITQTNTTTKLLMLKQGDYEMWRLRIEQYFQVQDYALWDVIESDNSIVLVTQLTTTEDGAITTTISSLVTTKENIKKKNDVKTRRPRNQDSRNRYQDSSRRTVNVEEAPPKAIVVIDGIGFDWSYMAEDEVPTNMALMDFSNSKGYFHLSNSGLEKFKHPEFESYGSKSCEKESKNASNDISNEHKESPDAPLAQDRVLNNKESSVESPVVVEKKTVVPTITKVEFVRPKQQEKPVRKPVKYAEMYRPNSAVSNVVRVNQVNVVKALAYWAWRPTKPNGALIILKRHNYIDDHLQKEDQGYVDSGCIKHMIRNMSYLSDFKKFDEGYFTFGGGAKGGRITGKGTLKTGKLNFENVYFVKELKFNLFSVSQMCDKKNSVIFTDTGCFVLSLDFKLTDESQVLLKFPRRNNMYSVDIKNIVQKESLTYPVAKATLDESMLWHRRLGHINFKNINKLVKDNLMRGLLSKHFENDQTCVACLKGKQHKSSCKSKVQNFISQPLFMLHIDLFGLTFVSSLMHKKYSLVVTDDYSRYTWVFFLASKDETSGILKKFLTERESLVDKKVKVIRRDNGTKFKNSVMNDFCAMKDHLGKFDGKADEGYFAGYSIDSKAFRVYKIRTWRVEENFHVRFLEDKPIIACAGQKWLFDIDILTESMNYMPVIIGTNSDGFADGSPLFDSSLKLSDDARSPSSGDTGKKHDEVSDKESRASNKLNIAFENLNTKYPNDPKMSGLETIATNDDSEEEMDVKSVFLYGRIKEEVYMCQPLGFEDPNHPNKLVKDKFQMSSMEELTFFLGLQVSQKEDRIFISQDKYVTKVLRKFNFSDVKSSNTPVDTKKTLVKDADGAYVDVHLYRSMIGSLMYLIASKPDIIYLKGHPKLGLWYPKYSPFELVAYTDSDYAGVSLDRKSITEGCQFLRGRLISWQYKKQTMVVTSTIEAESLKS
nr:putative ribonuclease H-like domain-containing protein [Tanacetum cinerariifolium]